MSNRPKPMLLVVLDGFGYRESNQHNAIAAAQTPNWDQWWQTCPHVLLSASGHDVGLPKGQMGNSEVGHTNIGAGRVVDQELTRIDKDIVLGKFFKNKALLDLCQQQKMRGQAQALHIMGLLSDGGVHSHIQHFIAILQMAAREGETKVYIHLFLDGRDTPPKSAETYIKQLEKVCDDLGVGQIVSIIGRYYAMDRDQRWDRTQIAYDLLTLGTAPFSAVSALEGLQAAYARGETDEFVQATSIHPVGKSPITLKANDGVIFMNFRADRARQLIHALTDDEFVSFYRAAKLPLRVVTLTEYAKHLPVTCAFPPQIIHNGLGEYFASLGLKQLRIAETEKYAHVTFFFNGGGREEPFPGEDRLLIPSPLVTTYDLKPDMSATELTDALEQAILQQKYDFIVCNYANADMVGHSGDFNATVHAIEAIDACLGRLDKALKGVGGEMLITADHGNAECMFDDTTGQAHTAHTTALVPCLYVGRPAQVITPTGILADVAPTVLKLMGLPVPPDMGGNPLFNI